MYENLLRSYKTGLVPPINFYRTKIKEPVIITPIKSSSNLSIFLGCLFFCIVSCWLYSSGAFFACCRTCKVLISTQIISVQWVPIIIYSWNLPSFFDYFFFILWMKIGESISNKSFQIWRVSETRRLVSTLPLWPLILSPKIRLRENREWNTCFRPRNSQIVYQLSPLYRLYRYVRRQKVCFF